MTTAKVIYDKDRVYKGCCQLPSLSASSYDSIWKCRLCGTYYRVKTTGWVGKEWKRVGKVRKFIYKHRGKI